MQYFDTESNPQKFVPLLHELRNLGYDVMIVNFPKYTTTNLENGQQVAIDGGAYYIESNAFALVKMINETNVKLSTNGSTNHIAIIAPSMAGQISRYALSYMEKNNIPHNVNLWVSVDSPHLGANIPLGDQGLIYRFQINSDQAIDFYQKDLSSPASQQQLIEFHRQIGNNADPNFQNAQTTSQGLIENRGNTFFQEHYNKQNSNGLANSHGWPQNLRKIALVNGSLTGSKKAQKLNGEPLADFASDGELVLSIRGFQKIKVFGVTVGTVHVASIESRFLPKSSTPIKISRFHKADKDRAVYAGNINNRGNMDNVPGGFYDAQDQLRKSVLKIDEFANFNIGLVGSLSILGTSGFWSQREFNPIHSFIPTFSAIAHLEPNQNWNNPLNYNLVCPTDKKTPFDSYFGGDKNTQHTSFTKESVEWLLKELDNEPQEPYFPVQNDALTGPSNVCKNANAVFSFLEVCELPGAVETWSVEGNLSLVTSTDYTVTVAGTSDVLSTGKIIATFHNGVRYEKIISIGKPKVTSHNINGGYDNVSVGASNTFSVSAEGANQYYWFKNVISTDCGCVTNSDGLTLCPPNVTFPKFQESNATTFTSTSPSAVVNWGNCRGSYVLNCRAVNLCGTTDIGYKIVNVYNSSGGGNDPCEPILQTSPNPVTDSGMTINLIPAPGNPCDDNVGEKINNIKIYDLYGNQVFSGSYNTDALNISGLNLGHGNYILNAFTSKGYIKREIIVVE